MEDIQFFLSEVDKDRAMDHIQWLTRNTPRRWSGSGDDQKAIEYILSNMSGYGLDTQMQKFVTFNSSPVFSALQIIGPEQIKMDSLPCCHIQPTPEGGLTAQVIDVGPGAESDYAGKDVRGKAVLVEVSYAPPTPEKARIAAARGAAAMICMNWGKDQPVICNRGLKAVWGNPTPQTINDIPQISGVSITRKDGEKIRALCAAHDKVVVNLQARSDNRWQELSQPVAVLESNQGGDEFILISGHVDAWEPGVTCNATGNGVMLELARAFAANREHLKRNLVFAFWNGHEIAEAAGSTWYVDNCWDTLRDHCIANFTIDSPGIIRASRYVAFASQELMDYTKNTLTPHMKEQVSVSRLKKIGDQSFMGIGIPSIYGRMTLSEQEITENNGATLGWWNHTTADTLDKCDPEVIAKDLSAYTLLMPTLANLQILPYNFTDTIKEIKGNLTALSPEEKTSLQLDGLMETTDRLGGEFARLHQWIRDHGSKSVSDKQANSVNRCLTGLSRLLTNPFKTVCDPYSQDSYGLSDLSAPIPLFHPIETRSKYPNSSQSYQLLQTLLIKRRNRISDALKGAADLTELTNDMLDR